MKLFGRLVFQTIAILLITALITEVALRVLHTFHPIPIFESISYEQFRVRPGADIYGFPANSAGFHDLETSFKKPENTYRIVAIGDSFAFGVVPYEHNFLTLLEKSLNQDPSIFNHQQANIQQIEVVNMGISRIGVREYETLLATEGLRYQPDLVIVCFFIGNDFSDVTPNEDIAPSSYLATFLRYFIAFSKIEGRSPKRKVYVDDQPSLRADGYQDIVRRKSQIFRRKSPIFVEEMPRIIHHFKKIKELCRTNDVDLIVALLPDEIQVDPRGRNTFISTIPGYRPRSFHYTEPNQALEKELEKIGIVSHDLFSVFWQHGKKESLYKPQDTHWNIRGNKIAAHSLENFLKEKASNLHSTE